MGILTEKIKQRIDQNAPRTPFQPEPTQRMTPFQPERELSLRQRDRTLYEKIADKIPTQIREGLFGVSRGERETFGSGSLLSELSSRGAFGFIYQDLFKPKTVKIETRYNKLREAGVDTDRALKIATQDITKTDIPTVAQRAGGILPPPIELTQTEQKTLRGIGLSERFFAALDTLDFVSLGTLGIGGDIIKTIAKTSDANKIERILVKEVKNIDQKQAKGVAQILARVDDPDVVKGFIDEVDFRINKVKEAAPATARTTQTPTAIQPRSRVSDDLIQEARKYKSAEEFVKNNDFVFQGVGRGKQSDFLTTKIGEANAYATQRGLKGSGEIRVYKYSDLPDYIKTITSDDSSYEQVIEAFGKDFVDRPLSKSEFERIQTAIGFNKDEIAKLKQVGTIRPDTSGLIPESQLKQIWERANKPAVSKQAPKPKLEFETKDLPERQAESLAFRQSEQQPLTTRLQSQSVLDNTVSSSLNSRVTEQGFDVNGRSLDELKDLAGEPVTLKDGSKVIDSSDVYELTTRQIKQTSDYKDFRQYAAQAYQNKDINPSITALGHVSFTAERLAEFMDDAIGGRMWREIIKPVYESAETVAKELDELSSQVKSFRVLEGSRADRDAFLYAEGKLKDASPEAKELASFVRNQYDELLERLNTTRKKVGIEPIPKRKDYITHLNELNALSDILGFDRISTNNRIRQIKKTLVEEKGFEEGRAWEAAKREVEGSQGVNRYVDSKHPRFDFAKQRLGDFQKNPSIIRSFKAYLPQALRYIHQAENVAKNKAFKDVLPPNAKEFIRKWNTEQVAGRPNTGWLSPQAKQILAPIRGTLGANTILGNLGTTLMQLTSFPQVFATAGIRNTFYGVGKRLSSYLSGTNNFNQSQVKALRDLGIDMGLGESLLDTFAKQLGKMEKLRDPAARARQAINFGRSTLKGIMELADQFTVGATYEAFYKKAIDDGLDGVKATDYANIMTGKTQANYFKEAIPPFLNSFEGRTIGQFGTYTMNQFEFFKRDFGKRLGLDTKSKRSVREFTKQFITFLTAAYIIDAISEETFGRQPYDIKSLTDEIRDYTQGDSDVGGVVSSVKDTAFSYVPFLGSVKFKSMPPLFEFGKDLFNATLGDGQSRVQAQNDIANKWSYNTLLPYGGNQVRKTAQGIESTTDLDLPFSRDVAEGKFEVQSEVGKVKSWLFGGYASDEAKEYYENRDKRDFLKKKYEISGSITSDENIAKLKEMTSEEYDLYTSGYADSTKKTLEKKIGNRGSLTDRIQERVGSSNSNPELRAKMQTRITGE